MDHEGLTTQPTRLAPLAQAGLAALVAGSLLTFSALAFNSAFEGVSPNRITASAPDTGQARPVVLPGTPTPAPPPIPREQASVEAAPVAPAPVVVAAAPVVEPGPPRDAVRGKRINKPNKSDKHTPAVNDRESRFLSGFGSHEDDAKKDHKKKGHKTKSHKSKNHTNNGNAYGHDKARGNGHSKHHGDHASKGHGHQGSKKNAHRGGRKSGR